MTKAVVSQRVGDLDLSFGVFGGMLGVVPVLHGDAIFLILAKAHGSDGVLLITIRVVDVERHYRGHAEGGVVQKS